MRTTVTGHTRIVVVKAGQYKDIGSFARPMSPEERRVLQALLDDVHGQFVAPSRWAQARPRPSAPVRRTAHRFRQPGQDLRMVDALGGFSRRRSTAPRNARRGSRSHPGSSGRGGSSPSSICSGTSSASAGSARFPRRSHSSGHPSTSWIEVREPPIARVDSHGDFVNRLPNRPSGDARLSWTSPGLGRQHCETASFSRGPRRTGRRRRTMWPNSLRCLTFFSRAC